MASFKVYRWDDASAPQVTGRDWTQLKNLFQKVFVDGYGSKSGLGWSIVETDDVTYKLLIKQNYTGYNASMSVLFDYSSWWNANNQWAVKITGSLNATAISSMGTPFLTTSTSATANGIQFPGVNGANTSTSSTRIIPWMIIGDDRTVYMIAGNNETITSPTIPPNIIGSAPSGQYPIYCFGDYVSYYNNFDYNQLGTSCDSSASLNSNTDDIATRCIGQSAYISNAVWRCSGKIGNASGGYDFRYLDANGTTTATYFGATVQAMTYPRPLDGGLYINRTRLLIEGDLAGHLKGCYYPMHNKPLSPAGGIGTFEGSGEYTGKTFIIVNNGLAELYFDMTTDWAV